MRPCHVLRVFTRGDEGGNHLGVVTDVTGLDDATMQSIAAELGFSETIYIDWRNGRVPNTRIFTPVAELPFAGHPLVGAAWTLSRLGPGTVDRVRCGVGEIPFRVDGDVAWVDAPLVSDVETTDASGVAAAVGLPAPVRSWWAKMPVPYLVIDLGSAEAVATAAPAISGLHDAGAGMTYLMARRGGRVKARFFAPLVGVPEDPATGSAAAALAAVLSFEGELSGELAIDQGDEIGTPSTIDLKWDSAVVSLGGSVRKDETRTLDA